MSFHCLLQVSIAGDLAACADESPSTMKSVIRVILVFMVFSIEEVQCGSIRSGVAGVIVLLCRSRSFEAELVFDSREFLKRSLNAAIIGRRSAPLVQPERN